MRDLRTLIADRDAVKLRPFRQQFVSSATGGNKFVVDGPRSGRQHKAWGVSPRDRVNEREAPAECGSRMILDQRPRESCRVR
jgi:hypothetical protein